ncbi:MAG: leucyl aminopeptidase [Deltaproteobacteria bacterium]|nr:leucyl aminopeptidase [Deltaproteobacteria bacterium]
MSIQWEQTTRPIEETAELLGVFHFSSGPKGGLPLGGAVARLDQHLKGALSRLLHQEEFKGKIGETKLFPTYDRKPLNYLLLIGAGEAKKGTLDTVRKGVARAAKEATRLKAKTLALELPSLTRERSTAVVQAAVEGVLLGTYRFGRYKSENHVSPLEKVVFTSRQRMAPAAFNGAIRQGEKLATATNFARDLINTPASDMTPRVIGREAEKIGKLPRISAKVYGKADIEKIGMGSFLAVAKGSAEPPVFVHLQYRPKGKSSGIVALVGKGVTFDSGGLSLKTAQSMETMKDDMSGAAAVLAVFRALSELNPSVTVHGFIPATENMPSGTADKPGDIARSLSGKTVEILNTDAEGRLILADALTFALKQKPDLLIDIATLTGACVIALGELCAGILGNDDTLIRKIIAAGEKTGEKVWQLPLIEEYKEELKTPIADVKNVGGRWGGTINGALFLQEFIGDHKHWAHIDIAGPSWTEKDLDYCPKGGTGSMVRTLLQFILDY